MKFDINVQNHLIRAVLDDFTPNDTFPFVFGGQYGSEVNFWKEAVSEFIVVFLRFDLFEVLPCMHGYHNKSADEIEYFLRSGDKENNFSEEDIWNVLYLTGSDRLNDIIVSCDLACWGAIDSELSLSLWNKLTQIIPSLDV